MTTPEPRHPFGELLTQHRRRKAGLTQTRLAELSGYDQAILVRMCQGKKDLTGPSGRERVVRLIEALADQGALTLVEEANALLLAADMTPLFARQPNEAGLIARLSHLQAGLPRRTNLPAALANFVGRAGEIAEVRSLLGATRLLTLTGSGGCGKTRLAQRVAADALPAYSDGAWYVELAALTDPALIPDEVMRALGLVASDRTATERVVDYLRERQTLIVLDNCEHLIDAAASFAVALLRACPRITILSTSREALGVEGETPWRVPPMRPAEAGRLFESRAAAARGGADLGAQADLVGHICQRLDGIPLAIELAAARLQTMSLADVSARLDDRFNLLSGGRRGVMPRQQTLRATLDWSYDALSEVEKIVFARLGVFMGGCAIEQAEQVIADEDLAPAEVLSALAQLAQKSLVTADLDAGETRYRLLETVREYALEKLNSAGDASARRRRHAEAFLRLVERTAAHIHTRDQRATLALLRRNDDNVRAALTWCFGETGDALIGCRLVGELRHYWSVASGHDAEAGRWIALARGRLTDAMPPAVRAWVWMYDDYLLGRLYEPFPRIQRALALFESAGDRVGATVAKSQISKALYYVNHDYEGMLRLSEEAVTESRALGDDWTLRVNLVFLAEGLRFGQRDAQRAEATYREALLLARAAGDNNQAARILVYYVSGFAQERLDFQEALRCAQEGLALLQSIDDPVTENIARCVVAENMCYLGDLSGAAAILENCMESVADLLDVFARVHPVIKLARVMHTAGDYPRAKALAIQALRLRLTQPMRFGDYAIFDVMAIIASAQGDALRAARLRGMADNMIALNNHYRRANHVWEYAPYMDRARAALGDAVYDAALAEGRATSVEQAVAYALGQS